MEAFGFYLLKSVIWLTGFALVYYLFLRNERFFLLNRFFLLSGILVSLVFPFISVRYIINLPVIPEFQTGNLTVTGYADAKTFSFSDLKYLLAVLYASGILFIAYGLLKQTTSVIKVIRKAKVISTAQVKLIRTSDYQSSFSFFSYVFINPSISEPETKEIVNHELAHIRQKHWFDLVLAQFICMFQWFSPVIWIYIRFVRQNHEYLADEVALQRTSDPAVYKATLLNQIVGAPVVSLANSFNYSINKKRFTMMKNIINSPYRRMKILFILPVFAIVLYAFAEPEYRYIPANQTSAEKTVYPDLQDKEVKGVVKEQGGKPLQGATVVVKGTTNATSADSKGVFKLNNVPESGELVISYIGFKSKVVKAVFNSEMTVQMIRDTVTLGVISMPPPPPPPPPAGFNTVNDIGTPPPPPPPAGFRTVNDIGTPPPPPPPPPLYIIDGVISDKSISDLPGSAISSVNVLKGESAVTKYGEKGKYGAVEITTNYNNEANSAKVQIKKTELAPASAPLLVVDGVISDKPVGSYDPNTIESLTVLKDESSTAMYGEKGKNGVLLITLKPGAKTLDLNTPIVVTGYRSQSAEPKNYKDKIQGNPLVIIDGVVSDKKTLDDLNPNDIESMNVLKGASQTDKYGDKAKDGVIEIITKKSDPDAVTVVGYKTKKDDTQQKTDEITVVGYKSKKNDTPVKNEAIEVQGHAYPEDNHSVITEEMPMYPGGQAAMEEFISGNLKYPAVAVKDIVKGSVPVSFTVDKSGKVTDVKVTKSVNPAFDKEAIRVVSSMPDWKPGRQNGLAVNVRMLIRVNFDLNQKVYLDKK